MAKSIYETIEKNIKEGKLSELSIRKDSFADGAVDGMYIYHMAHNENGEDINGKIENVIKKACTGNFEKADKLYLDIKKLTIEIIDDIQEVLYKISDSINQDKLWLYLEHLIFETDNPELVKLGLSIIEVFEIDEDEELKGYIRTLGLCNEFTLFAVFIMRKWTKADEEIIELIKNVSGWGRIHGISNLSESISQDIKTWLLEEGWNNDVLIEYSCLDVFEKGEGRKALSKEKLSDKELTGLGNIILTSMMTDNPKPTPCLEVYEDLDQIADLWLSKATGSEDENVKRLIDDIKFEKEDKEQ